MAPCQKQNDTFSAAAWCVSSMTLLPSTMHPSLGKVILAATCLLPGARLGSIGRGSTQASHEARAALMEYDGRLPRAEAERLAGTCIQSAGDV